MYKVQMHEIETRCQVVFLNLSFDKAYLTDISHKLGVEAFLAVPDNQSGHKQA